MSGRKKNDSSNQKTKSETNMRLRSNKTTPSGGENAYCSQDQARINSIVNELEAMKLSSNKSISLKDDSIHVNNHSKVESTKNREEIIAERKAKAAEAKARKAMSKKIAQEKKQEQKDLAMVGQKASAIKQQKACDTTEAHGRAKQQFNESPATQNTPETASHVGSAISNGQQISVDSTSDDILLKSAMKKGSSAPETTPFRRVHFGMPPDFWVPL
ncbi:hypothetical protein AB6A40_006300 [Gnathostoma spinigerum]|uniref:Uncharacterized protein n=1 Tax=Gnathostoma spinigerum TaxID=75299 RepID=A0ABD6EK34_9BILA